MQDEYLVGVMITPVEATDEELHTAVGAAVKNIEELLAQRMPQLQLEIFEFIGPHLTPIHGSYSSLELLRLGMIEKVERKPNFLLVVTEVELSSHLTTFSTALASPLTNVAVLSTRRLDPRFWEEASGDARHAVTAQRLTGLMMHTIGSLLNLRKRPEATNIMYRFEDLDDLEAMREITDDQVRQMQRSLPQEARDKTAKTPARGFVLRRLQANSGSIWRTIIRSNPFRLATDLTTMIAAAISLMVVIFFSTEMWDVGSTVEFYQFVLFALLTLAIATLVVYRAYPLRAVANHTHRVSESLVVTNAATLITLLLTMLVLYTAFWLLVYFGILTLFPRTLMETWPTVDPAVRTLDHVKISTFIAAMGILVGSLGGRVENQKIMSRILFRSK